MAGDWTTASVRRKLGLPGPAGGGAGTVGGGSGFWASGLGSAWHLNRSWPHSASAMAAYQQIDDLEDTDAAILSSDLPIDAYLDRGSRMAETPGAEIARSSLPLLRSARSEMPARALHSLRSGWARPMVRAIAGRREAIITPCSGGQMGGAGQVR